MISGKARKTTGACQVDVGWVKSGVLPLIPNILNPLRPPSRSLIRGKSSERQKARGFTLIELMVTLAVLAIALSVGVPTYQTITARSGLSAASNDLLAALAMTRSEALKRDAIVSLQAVSAEPTDTLGGGYCIVVGNPGNCSGTLVRRFAALNSAINVVISGGVSSISFDGLGGLTNAGGGTRQVTVCRSGITGRQISVAVAGRAKLSDFAGC
jgi:type IV fimbrial biogenesis protein FimT